MPHWEEPDEIGLEYGAGEDGEDPKTRGKRLHAVINEGLLDPGKRKGLLAGVQNAEDAKVIGECWDETTRIWNNLTDEQRARAVGYFETKLDLSAIGMEEGTPDFGLVVPPTDTEDGIVFVRDWKSGYKWVQPARHNLQLICYAIGMILRHCQDFSRWLANVGIVQPLTRAVVDVATLSKTELEGTRQRIVSILEAANRPESPCIPGPWCTMCGAVIACPAYKERALTVQQHDNPIATLQNLSLEGRREFYESVKAAQKFIDKVHEAIDAAIFAGQLEVAGYGIGPGKRSRKWMSEDSAMWGEISAEANSRGMDLKSLVKLPSPPQLEKVFGKAWVESRQEWADGKPTIKKL
jgi:hypothetical protein